MGDTRNFTVGLTEFEMRTLLKAVDPLTLPGVEQQTLNRILHKLRKTLTYVEAIRHEEYNDSDTP